MDGPERRLVIDAQQILPGGHRALDTDRAERADAAPDLDPTLMKEELGDRPTGDAGSALACRSPLEDVSQIVPKILDTTG